MTEFKKISELDLITAVADTDLFIVETTNGTKAVKIETFKQNEITKEDVGLGNCDNTSDLDKPISNATQTALDLKANISDIESTYATKADVSSTYITQQVYEEFESETIVELANKVETTDYTAFKNTVEGQISDIQASLEGVEDLLSQI